MPDSQLDLESAEYSAKHHGTKKNSSWKARQVLRAFARVGLQPSTVGEVGCGAGVVLRALHNQLPDSTSFVGYETAPEAYALCAQQAAPRLEFICSSPLESDIRFDVLCCLHVFEHVEVFLGLLRS